jgi:hypothetical protein
MPTPANPIIDLDLESNGGLVQFYSVEEVQAWVTHEVTFWQWLQKSTSYDANTRSIWNQQASPWNRLNDNIAKLKSNPPDPEKEKYLQSIRDILVASYKARKSLHSSTPAAKKLLEYSSDDTNQIAIITAAYMLGYFINAPVKFNVQRPDSIINIVRGNQEAMLFAKGISGISDAERSAMNELRQTAATLNNDLAEQTRRAKDSLASSENSLSNLQRSISEKFDKLFETSSKTLEDISNTYDKKLALQAAVKYWTDKAERHRNLSILFGAAFVVTLLTAGYLGFLELYPLLKDVPANERPEYSVIALIIISAVVSIWIVRLIVRVLLSHIHLQRDSSERATMLLTYLALLREGSGLKDDEKKLILQSLFRPSVSGIVKDDAIPTGLYDFITRPK